MWSGSRCKWFCCSEVKSLVSSRAVIYNQVIGNDNLIMGSCHVAHDCKVGNNNIFANGTLLGGHVVVEVRHKFNKSYCLVVVEAQFVLNKFRCLINVGLCSHRRSYCFSSVLPYWLFLFCWRRFCGMIIASLLIQMHDH